MLSKDGREHVVGFYLPKEPVGLEGTGSGLHGLDVVARENSRVLATAESTSR
jgi:CRP-like cAMP-binding protein